MFKQYKSAFQKNVALLFVGQITMFKTDVSPDLLWETYLASYTGDAVRDNNCNCCRQFIKHYGNIVAIVDNKLVSMWDFDATGIYKDAVLAMDKLVTSANIVDVFVHQYQKVGSDTSVQKLEDGTTIRWDHLFFELPKQLVYKSKDSVESEMGGLRDSKNLLKRALTELTVDASETMLELITQNSLYRGAESKGIVEAFLKFQNQYSKVEDDQKDNFCWKHGTVSSNQAVSRIRNSSTGTFLVDVSNGVDLDSAVAKFEKVMAPANYKRPTPVITKRTIEDAEKKLTELGLVGALSRRFATSDDITVNNVLYVNRDKKVSGIFAELAEDITVNAKTLTKMDTMTLKDFINKILPTSTSLDILLENKHEQKLMSLIAPVDEGPGMFKWNNNFSWSYNNAVADSMREKVVAAGGRVDGALRFTHSWNHNGDNQSLMDLHVFFPTNQILPNRNDGSCINDIYGNGNRVGWNNRTNHSTSGKQDVDFTSPPGTQIPLENISFPSIDRMPEGTYTLKIHNWGLRLPTSNGFKAEIEFGNQLFQYEYTKPMKNKEWVTVAEVTLKNGEFTIKHHIDSTHSCKDVWGLKTNKFVKANMVLRSPNFWDGQGVGNEHVFFILDGADNTGITRGFFNEFLKEDLMKHKKVFEALAEKMKIKHSKKQLSGLGFSSTGGGEFIAKVSGKFTRTIKVTI